MMRYGCQPGRRRCGGMKPRITVPSFGALSIFCHSISPTPSESVSLRVRWNRLQMHETWHRKAGWHLHLVIRTTNTHRRIHAEPILRFEFLLWVEAPALRDTQRVVTVIEVV